MQLKEGRAGLGGRREGRGGARLFGRDPGNADHMIDVALLGATHLEGLEMLKTDSDITIMLKWNYSHRPSERTEAMGPHPRDTCS